MSNLAALENFQPILLKFLEDIALEIKRMD